MKTYYEEDLEELLMPLPESQSLQTAGLKRISSAQPVQVIATLHDAVLPPDGEACNEQDGLRKAECCHRLRSATHANGKLDDSIHEIGGDEYRDHCRSLHGERAVRILNADEREHRPVNEIQRIADESHEHRGLRRGRDAL